MLWKSGLCKHNANLKHLVCLRSGSGLTSRFMEVLKSGTLQPTNPILDSSSLPEFSRFLPYHLESAITTAKTQYKVELAETEVALTATVGDDNSLQTIQGLLNRLDRLESPISQLTEVGRLYTELAALPDQKDQWKAAYGKAKSVFQNEIQPFTQSKIIHKALVEMADMSNDNDFPAHLRLAFEKEGVSLVSGDQEEKQQQLEEIQHELRILEEKLEDVSTSNTATSKAERLQMIKNFYNVIGLTHLQAQQLSYRTVSTMAMTAHNNMAKSLDEVFEIQSEVAEFLKPHLPEVKITLDEEAGAFLPTNQSTGPSDSEKEIWRAKQSVKNLLRLHGVIQGLKDFCKAIFGIEVVEEETNASKLGWNKNVRIFHLHDVGTDMHLGTIYLDLFRDPYWRSQEASDIVMTRLFSKRQSQTEVPVGVVALSIEPSWDDAPNPITWKDFQDLLYQFGMALQLILTKNSSLNNQTPFFVQAADCTEFLATFMTMWVHNDGFLQRIAQLSQDQFTFQPELMNALRDDLKKQKALELMETVFLSNLELTIFTDFDPRGDETLVSLQQRLAEEYIPHNVPFDSDLSPLVEIFRGKAIDPSMKAYGPLWSEILAAMAYEKFSSTDLTNDDEVKRLGRGIRNLFLSEETSGKEAIEMLCEKKFSSDELKNVYDF